MPELNPVPAESPSSNQALVTTRGWFPGLTRTKARAISTVLLGIAGLSVPIASAYIGSVYALAASTRETNAKFVEIAVSIMNAPTGLSDDGRRDWAIRVLEHYSEVPFAIRTREQLIDSVALFSESYLQSKPAPIVDLRVNGREGPITKVGGQGFFRLSWTASNVSSCLMSSPFAKMVPVSHDETISSGDARFPTPGHRVTLTIVCSNGRTETADTQTVEF